MIKETILLLFMFFCHIIADYNMQGWLASAKQKEYWEKNYPDDLYKKDYIIALIEHSFSWAFMIHLPIFILIIKGIIIPANLFVIISIFILNIIIHVITDDLKANEKIINLVEDQCIHICQIVLTWIYYINI